MQIDDTHADALASCKSCNHSFHPRKVSVVGTRVTLTRTQLQMPEIEEFVVLLVNIAADGVLEYEELHKLTEWLNGHVHLDVPAVKFMVDLMLGVCEDEKITEEETFQIQLGIERVLPKEYRTQIAETRKKVYYDQPATVNQLNYIESLTRRRPVGISKRQASEMLDALLVEDEGPPASNRQIMFLRFWNRLDLADKSCREVSTWMDYFIEADYGRWLAWEKFKEEIGDDGSQRDPSFVPIDAGDKYLRKVYQQLE
jgi:hypothetical protein